MTKHEFKPVDIRSRRADSGTILLAILAGGFIMYNVVSAIFYALS